MSSVAISTQHPIAMGPTEAELQHAIACYRRHLPPGELFDFDIQRLDHLGIPVWVASYISARGYVADGFGYGATLAEAQVGAFGELSETAHVEWALRRCPTRDGLSYRELCRREGSAAVVDPLTLCLPAGSPYHPDLPLRWVPVVRHATKERCWIPREFVAVDGFMLTTQSPHRDSQATGATPHHLVKPITCGLGAGLTLAQALVHGALELLQRDGNCTRFRALDRGQVIALDSLADEGVRQLLAHLNAQGVAVTAKLASTEFGLVNLYVLARPSPQDCTSFPLQFTACGEAVHANRERALRKALLEFIAARCRKAFMHGPLAEIAAIAPGYLQRLLQNVDVAGQEPRALAAMGRWLTLTGADLHGLLADTVYSQRAVVPLSSLPSASDASLRDPADRLADLVARLKAQGLDLYYFDGSPEEESGPRVVKAIVPGLEGETMSYYRLGERGVRRLLADGYDFVGLWAPPPGARPVRLTPAAAERLGGAPWLHPKRVDAAVGETYPLYREPASHTAQLALAARDR